MRRYVYTDLDESRRWGIKSSNMREDGVSYVRAPLCACLRRTLVLTDPARCKIQAMSVNDA
jgi:hypothetical protein